MNTMKVGEIWEFDNGFAYHLNRIVAVNPQPDGSVHIKSINNGNNVHGIIASSDGWRKIGDGPALSFDPFAK